MRSRGVLAIGITIVVVLSGCSSIPGFSSASISEPEVSISSDGQPELVFNYSVDDFATVLLEGPSGDVISEERLEPDKNHDAVSMGLPLGGTYRLVVRQDGETVASTSVTYDGPQPELVSVSSDWSKGRLEGVMFGVENHGDLPLLVVNASFSVRGQEVKSGPVFEWVRPGEMGAFDVSPLLPGGVTVESGGEIEGRLIVLTTGGELNGQFTHTIEPASFSIERVVPSWDSGQLMSIEFTVRNTGEISGEFRATASVNGEFVGAQNDEIKGGQTRTYVLEAGYGTEPLYTVQSEGSYEVKLSVSGPSGSDSYADSKSFDGANAEISNAEGSFLQNYGSDNLDLFSLSFTVQNTGDLSLIFDSVRIKLNDESRTVSLLFTRQLQPIGTTDVSFFLDEDITVEAGRHTVTIQLLRNGKVVGQDSVTISTG